LDFTFQKHFTFSTCCAPLSMIVEPGPVSEGRVKQKQNKTLMELYFVSLIKDVEEMHISSTTSHLLPVHFSHSSQGMPL
jgi:hypothetical protein